MAKAFKFELQDVLDFRNFEQEQAQNELAKALAVEAQINNQLQNIAAQFVNVQSRMDTYTDFEDIAAGNRRKELLDSQKEQLLQELAKAKLVSNEKRAALDQAMKKTTALEKLKEKQLEDWKEEEDRKESEMIDDLANSGKRFHQ